MPLCWSEAYYDNDRRWVTPVRRQIFPTCLSASAIINTINVRLRHRGHSWASAAIASRAAIARRKYRQLISARRPGLDPQLEGSLERLSLMRLNRCVIHSAPSPNNAVRKGTCYRLGANRSADPSSERRWKIWISFTVVSPENRQLEIHVTSRSR